MSLWFLLPALALLAGAFALVPLGRQVLMRRVVFIDLAVAQAAAAGSLWAMVALHGEARGSAGGVGLTDAAGLVGALACAACVAGIQRRWPAQREALIGLLYVVFASLALVGAGLDAHGRERMLELLAADVLWAQGWQVALLAAAAAALWALQVLRPAWAMRDLPFYAAFAGVVSVAVPVLGLFVVFALLIAPALWLMQRGPGLLQAALLGTAAGWIGLALSWVWDVPSGPCVAGSCALTGLAALLRRPHASQDDPA